MSKLRQYFLKLTAFDFNLDCQKISQSESSLKNQVWTFAFSLESKSRPKFNQNLTIFGQIMTIFIRNMNQLRFWKCSLPFSRVSLPVNYQTSPFLVIFWSFLAVFIIFHWRLWTTKTIPSSNICCLLTFWSFSRWAIDALSIELKSPTNLENFERRSVSIFSDFTKFFRFLHWVKLKEHGHDESGRSHWK